MTIARGEEHTPPFSNSGIGLFDEPWLCVTSVTRLLVPKAEAGHGQPSFHLCLASVTALFAVHHLVITTRRQRKLLNPAFSHAQMRRITPLMQNISTLLKDRIFSEIMSEGSEGGVARAGEVDFGDWLGRAAL